MARSNQKPLRESDRIEIELRRLILTLELQPGLAVSEANLMKQFNWGRTPLREAFQRLSEQSLLQIIPHHGVVVTPLNVFEFVEVMDAMRMVIGSAAALACRYISETQLEKLDELVEQGAAAAKAGDFVLVSELDYEFHRELAEATGNRYLRNYLLHLHRIAARFNFAAWKRDQNAAPSMDEHRQLAALFREREVEQVKTAMREHIENARVRLMRSLNPAES